VRADRRSQGIGRQLVEYVMRSSYDNGIDKLYLFTPDSVDFYQHLGWRIVSNENYQEHDVTVMKAELTELF
jgi:N-acetylglutamate synthase-like GNAT family acetyltransferase